MKIEVTQQDIDRGDCGNPFNCPIALAIKRVTGEDDRVYVFHEYVINLNRGYYKIPKAAQEFVKSFDNHEAVKPFSFKLGRCKKL